MRPRAREATLRLARLLALALLLAQFGAELHVYYSHALADPVDHLGAARNCGTCVAYSQLQNAVDAPQPRLPARSVAWVAIVPESAIAEFRSEPFRAFRSRAPPALV